MTFDENGGLNSPLLGDITYEPPKPRETLPDGTDPRLANAERPVLDDFDSPQSYQRPTPNAGGIDPRLAHAVAPVLDDMSSTPVPALKPVSQYQPLSADQIATLQGQRAAQGLPPYTDEEIAELNADFIERQRMQAQQAAAAKQAAAAAEANIVLEETTYTAPEKKSAAAALPKVDASALLEEPAPEPERKPSSFNQEDLEAAKRAAMKRQAENLSETPKSDPEESRRQLQALRQQQQADLSAKGFTTSIILTVIGVLAGLGMLLFGMGGYTDGEAPNSVFSFVDTVSKIGGVVLVLLAVTIVLRVQQLKGLTSFMFGASTALLLIFGLIMSPYKRGTSSFGLTVAGCVICVIGAAIVTFTMATSDKLTAYYNRSEIIYD